MSQNRDLAQPGNNDREAKRKADNEGSGSLKKFKSERVSCDICCEKHTRNFTCVRQHKLCKDCLQAALNSFTPDSCLSYFPCPVSSCDGEVILDGLHLPYLESVRAAQELFKSTRTIWPADTSQPQLMQQGITRCPFCQNQMILQEYGRVLECINCSWESCRYCLTFWPAIPRRLPYQRHLQLFFHAGCSLLQWPSPSSLRNPEILPAHWTEVSDEVYRNNKYETVSLSHHTEEYIEVAKFFYGTSRHLIRRIYRVQNKDCWRSYLEQRNSMAAYLEETGLNERFLYYKTRKHYVTSIMANGFDKRKSEHQFYGKGNYFYSKACLAEVPGQEIRVFIARVLCGHWNKANPSDGQLVTNVQPLSGDQPVTSNHEHRWDSLVDNIQHPEIVVVVNNNQSYPAYYVEAYP